MYINSKDAKEKLFVIMNNIINRYQHIQEYLDKKNKEIYSI